MEIEKIYVNTQAAAKLVGKTAGTLANARYLSQGLPYIKARGRVLYDVRDLQRYLEDCKIYPENR